MKSESSVQKSADGALHSAVKLCAKLKGEFHSLQNGEALPQEVMPRLRAILSELTQRIHEFNAYTNVILTD